MKVYAIQYCEMHAATTLRSLWVTKAKAAREARDLAAAMTRADCVFGSYEVWEYYVGGTGGGGEYLSSHYGPYSPDGGWPYHPPRERREPRGL